MITPNVGFTPFKSNPLDKLHAYTSRDIKAAEAPYINPRPNCMKDRIKGPKVTNSSAFAVPPPNVFKVVIQQVSGYVPYSGKFSRGAKFHVFRGEMDIRENLNVENFEVQHI